MPVSAIGALRERSARSCRTLRKAFLDVNISIEDLIAEGDRVVMRYTERGTLAREIFGVSPSGQSYAKSGVTVYRHSNGKRVESWGVEDTLGWLRQLGADPSAFPSGLQAGAAGKASRKGPSVEASAN